MIKDFLTFVPSGGLGNRMRAIASAYVLAKRTNVCVNVIWFKDWLLNARFSELFKPVNTNNMQLSIKDANLWDKIANDRPRKHNLWIPKLPEALRFQQRIDEYEVDRLVEEDFDFCSWCKNKRSFMSCWAEFQKIDSSLYKELFVPSDAVNDIINEYTKDFSSHTIGMHIRRTDNRDSIERSPLSLFIDAARKELNKEPQTKIFLATDDENVKSKCRETFPGKVITSMSAANRGSAQGIVNALAEMYALAKTKIIYGSYGSSFSQIAAKIYGAEISILDLNSK